MRCGDFLALFVDSLLKAIIYCIFVFAIGFLSIYGLGYIVFPQPFIDVVVGRWGVWFNVFSFSTVTWFLYIYALHLLYILFRRPRYSWIYISIIIYLINVLFIETGFTDTDYRYLVTKYVLIQGGFAIGVLIALAVEYIAYRVSKAIVR
jgi:hypothetical protein